MQIEAGEKLWRRILQLTVRQPWPGGCWIWTGARMYPPGHSNRPYGYLWISGRKLTVRRLVYTLAGNSPPLGNSRIGTRCGNSLCLNPDHLVKSFIKSSKGRPPKRFGVNVAPL